jgi:3-hydroxyacyl-CoA dehydrogenase
MNPPLRFRRAAVLGAGVMGAQIAAHLTNAGLRVLLLDLPENDPDSSALAGRAVERLRKMEPAPLVDRALSGEIECGNYEQDAGRLANCDLIIEAVSEKLETKRELYRKLAPQLDGRAVFVTNTSGLSIATLAHALPETQRARFCGVHFFNPPRYMRLVELVPSPMADPQVLDSLEEFLTTRLGKGVIRALDTPNFIGNRVGLFAMLAAMHQAERFGLGFDTVDALTGALIERPRSATFGTLDLIGLDTFNHILASISESLRDDPWHAYFQPTAWSRTLIGRDALGRKSGRGVFWIERENARVYDVTAGDYRPVDQSVDPEVAAMLRLKNSVERFAALRGSARPQARFLWALFRDTFHYCAVHLEHIATCARDVDLALRWGFGWRRGPFETWQAGGWTEIAEAIRRDVESGVAMARVPLPDWVFDGRVGVHADVGSFSARERRSVSRRALPVYARQLQPERVLGEGEEPGRVVFENDAIRYWHSPEDSRGEIAILSFKTKLNSIGADVLAGIEEAVGRAVRAARRVH